MDGAAPSNRPTIAAVLEDGPLKGMRVETEILEGRPPKTIEVERAGETWRYVLSEWVQKGPSASYSCLYRV
jgi:hypothetical protein